MSSEEELTAELRQYKEQLEQVNAMISNVADNTEFSVLKVDLESLIHLTEESLLDIKKQRLLGQLDTLANSSEITETHWNWNNVFTSEKFKQKESKLKESDEAEGDESGESKCRVFFECSQTNVKMHNAIILGGDDSSDTNVVRVLFCNPTQTCMQVCSHFMKDTCRFDDKCKYSHGFKVRLDELQPYKEPNFKGIRVGADCLAKHNDGVWHLASVVSLDDNNVCVQFKKFNLTAALTWESILLTDNQNEESNTSSSDYDYSSEEEYDESLPTTSKILHHGLGDLGDWEKHTRGIASKLMSKMGYVAGKGLGKEGEGRIEPVEVIALPQGSISLDSIMELKAKKLLKKRVPKKKRSKNKNTQVNDEEKLEEKETDMFDFINEKLATKKDLASPDIKRDIKTSLISAKGLNIQMLQTHNEIVNIEKTISKLKESLVRNKNGDKATIDQIKQKLQQTEQTLAKLRKSESDIQSEKSSRKRKSDIF